MGTIDMPENIKKIVTGNPVSSQIFLEEMHAADAEITEATANFARELNKIIHGHLAEYIAKSSLSDEDEVKLMQDDATKMSSQIASQLNQNIIKEFRGLCEEAKKG